MKLTIIIPCYNESENILPLFVSIQKVLQNLNNFTYELIFIDDGSKDSTITLLKDLHERYPQFVTVISFSRNFGKEAAIYAGLKYASGDYTSIIDADLQQRPEIIIEMINFLEKHMEYDVVAAYQKERIESTFISICKKTFYKLMNKISDTEFYPGASDFRTFRKNVVEAIISLPEYFRFSKGIFSWVGFETYYMPYIASERNAGKSKWSIRGLIKYALEGFISFTTFPLKLGIYIGLGVSSFSMIFMIIIVIQKLFFSIDIPGYPTLIILILLLGGIQLLILGIIGEYIARTYIQGKNRPIYIEKEYLSASDKQIISQ